MNLPQHFLDEMKTLLGEDYEAWLSSYEQTPHQGLRINRTKTTAEHWSEISPFEGCEPVTWTDNGFYYPDELRPARHPYYFAGLYYLQEPSAMTPAQILAPEPGDRVLDLCAAPGGKSTELGARLAGEGLLVSNDISNSRAKALLKNLELFGIPNICVVSDPPERLAENFGEFFDRILVDAPCSGEGMFRKDPDLIRSWEERGPEDYAPIQKEILSQAVRMLKPGGFLLYSTCTFAQIEDEEVILWLLAEFPELELVPIPLWDGAVGGMDGEAVVRLFPHKIRGEGHFLALLQKKHEQESKAESAEESESGAVLAEAVGAEKAVADQQKQNRKKKNKAIPRKNPYEKEIKSMEKESDFLEWEKQCAEPFDRSRMMIKNNCVYLLPETFDPSWNLRYLRTGLLLGEWKGKRFEPSQAVAMAMKASDFCQTLNLSCEDDRVIRYLKDETIALEENEIKWKKGWVLVCVDDYPLGWAKYAGGSLKNKYYPGWRWQ